MSTLRVPSRRRSGFTLIEVAIALALFVFGALAIVRIFPPALGVIRNNEYRSTATQIGQTTLAKMSSGVSSVPDAVFNGDATGTWSDVDKAVVGTATKNSSVPKTPIDTTSALDAFKYIRGEHHVFKTIGGTSYVLLNFPTISTNVKIYQEDVIDGVQIGSNGLLDFSNAYSTSTGQAFNDASNGFPKHPPAAKSSSTGVTYYVSYRWRYSGQAPKGVIDEPINLPSGAWTGDQGKVLQGLVSSSNQIIPGGISIRYRQYWGYALPSNDEAERGYVNLTTRATQVNGDPSLIVGKHYSYDYIVSDWRNLVSDDAPFPTSSANAQVSLPVKGLDENTPVYGLITSGSAAPSSSLTPSLTRANLKNGTVPYDTSAYAAARARTVYRTLDVWTHQISVAARSYLPIYQSSDFAAASAPGTRPATLPREPWREYYWDGAGNLYFHASEAGKTVSLSCTIQTSPGVYKTLTGINLTIDDDLVDAPSTGIPANFSTAKVAQAQITDLAGALLSPGSILSIQGLSVQARTAWLNNDRYNQVLVPGYRALTN